jgi:hypothetical protein
VSLGRVSARFLAGVGAWLLGAGAATGGSLLAVSALGQGLAPTPSQQLTVTAVNDALASEKAKATPPAAVRSPMPPVSSSATPLAPRPKKSSPAPSTPAQQPGTTDLISVGGSVVAVCQPAGAYLVSWSPAQGYEAYLKIRGPAPNAKVTFADSHKMVTMTVSCSGGVPAASTRVNHDE